jgi:hypothetical protein
VRIQAAAMAIAALAACATSSDVRREGVRSEYPLVFAPEPAARCIGIQFSGLYPFFKTTHRVRPDGVVELTGYEFEAAILVMEISRAAQGSSATVWLSKTKVGQMRPLDGLMQGC